MGLLDDLKADAKKVAEQLTEGASKIDLEKIKAHASDLAQKATDQVNAFTRTAPPAQASAAPPPPPMAPLPGAAVAEGQAAAPPPPAPTGEALDVEALKAKAQELLGVAKDKAIQLKDVAAEKTDAAAISVAKKVSEKTGREVTPSQVKTIALAAGVALLAVGAIDLIADAVLEGGLEGGGELAGDAVGGSGDVVGDAGRLMAENGGSLNIEQVVVDIDGCQI